MSCFRLYFRNVQFWFRYDCAIVPPECIISFPYCRALSLFHVIHCHLDLITLGFKEPNLKEVGETIGGLCNQLTGLKGRWCSIGLVCCSWPATANARRSLLFGLRPVYVHDSNHFPNGAMALSLCSGGEINWISVKNRYPTPCTWKPCSYHYYCD